MGKDQNGSGLRRALGLREAVALGVGGTIGGGIFVLVGEAAGTAGPGVLISFVLAFLASLLIALPYAELSCRYPQAGGGYAMARAVMGPHWGFVMGWVFWGAYVFISGYVTIGFGGYLGVLTGLPTVVGAVTLVAASTALNLGGVKMSGRAQSIVIGLGILALAGFALLGLPEIDPDRLAPFFPQGLGGVALATLLTFLAFGGFDMVAAAGEEVADPDRNLPRAILLTLFLVLGLYLLVAFVAVGVLPYGNSGPRMLPSPMRRPHSSAPRAAPSSRWPPCSPPLRRPTRCWWSPAASPSLWPATASFPARFPASAKGPARPGRRSCSMGRSSLSLRSQSPSSFRPRSEGSCTWCISASRWSRWRCSSDAAEGNLLRFAPLSRSWCCRWLFWDACCSSSQAGRRDSWADSVGLRSALRHTGSTF